MSLVWPMHTKFKNYYRKIYYLVGDMATSEAKGRKQYRKNNVKAIMFNLYPSDMI